MSLSPTSPTTAPGWFPDPAGGARLQWWDGAAWSGYFADMPVEGKRSRPLLEPKTPLFTPFFGAILWLPVALIIIDLVLKSIHAYEISVDGTPVPDPELVFTLGDVVSIVSSMLLCAGCVVLAYLDWRRLRRLGVVRPFHWAWAFLSTIYVIGRTVVARKVVPLTSVAPIWIFIALSVISNAISRF